MLIHYFPIHFVKGVNCMTGSKTGNEKPQLFRAMQSKCMCDPYLTVTNLPHVGRHAVMVRVFNYNHR